MNLFRQAGSEPGGFEDVIDDITESLRRTVTDIVVKHLEGRLVAPSLHMSLADRHMELMEDERDYSVDLLLFHAVQLRYIAVQVHVGRFDLALIAHTRRAVTLLDPLIRDPEIHGSTVGILLCTDAPAYAPPGPVAVALYDDLSPDEEAGMPAPHELVALVEHCFDTTTLKHAAL